MRDIAEMACVCVTVMEALEENERGVAKLEMTSKQAITWLTSARSPRFRSRTLGAWRIALN